MKSEKIKVKSIIDDLDNDIHTLSTLFQCGSHFIPIINQSKNQTLYSSSIP